MKRYRIGDFAEQMGVSNDFLKYYEQNGLIRSYQDPVNHYRYYDFSQCQYVSRIQYLRSMGYSVKEIEMLLKSATREEVIDLFHEKAQFLQSDIDRYLFAISELNLYKKSLQYGRSGMWYIVQMPAIYFLPHTYNEDFIRDDKTIALIKKWTKELPYTFDIDTWHLIMSKQDTLTFSHMNHGRAIYADIAEKIDLDVSEPAYMLPSTRCVEYHLEYVHAGQFHNSPSLTEEKYREALKVIQEKDFKVAGNMFVRFFSFFMENGLQCEHDVLYIPIE